MGRTGAPGIGIGPSGRAAEVCPARIAGPWLRRSATKSSSTIGNCGKRTGCRMRLPHERRSGISVDQMTARHVGQDIMQPCLHLVYEQPMTGYHETHYSLAYSSHLSWQSADQPAPNQT